jgi:hypothetical protein
MDSLDSKNKRSLAPLATYDFALLYFLIDFPHQNCHAFSVISLAAVVVVLYQVTC